MKIAVNPDIKLFDPIHSPVRNSEGAWHLRWVKASDVPEILAIDRTGRFSDRWNRVDFSCAINDRDAICKAVVREGHIVAYAVWGSYHRELYLIRLVVLPEFRRRGIGTLLLIDGLRRLSERRTEAWTRIPEENLAAQLWLKTNGWIATGIDEGHLVFDFRVEWRE